VKEKKMKVKMSSRSKTRNKEAQLKRFHLYRSSGKHKLKLSSMTWGGKLSNMKYRCIGETKRDNAVMNRHVDAWMK
jgi:hypothetical protein